MRNLRLPALLLCWLASRASHAQPANDDPCSAIAIVLGDTCVPVNESNIDATATVGIPLPACGNYQGNDVWFSFTAPVGIVNITMTTASFDDGAMALYAADSCDGAFTLVACDDDAGPGLMPRISRDDLEPGRIYWLRAFGYGADTGTFSLCATGPIAFPAGDCVFRLELLDTFGDGWQGAFVVASVNGGAATTYTCGGFNATYLIGLQVGDVLTLTYGAGSADNENHYWLRFGTNGPTIYDSGFPPMEGLAFTMDNTCVPINGPPTDCLYRTPVCMDTTFEASALSTGTVADLVPFNQGCLASGERAGVWAEFWIAESGELGFTVSPATTADFDFALWGPYGEVVCPLSGPPVRCSYSAVAGTTGLLGSALDASEGAGGDSFVDTLHVTAGQRYVLYIDNFSSNGSAFDLTFQLTGGAALACTPVPEAAFTVSDNTVLVGEAVSFTDQSTGSPYSWQWYFPGANEGLSLEQDPQGITYALPGCYDVSLTATNIAGSDATTHICEVDVSVSASVAEAVPELVTARMNEGMLVIERAGRTDAVHVALLDASGRLIDGFVDRGLRITRRMNSLPPGCYTIVLSGSDQVRSLRLLVSGF